MVMKSAKDGYSEREASGIRKSLLASGFPSTLPKSEVTPTVLANRPKNWQHKWRLAVYLQFQSRDIGSVDDDPKGSAVKLVERALGKPVTEVQMDFDAWFVDVEKNGIRRSANSDQLIEK